MPHICVAAVCLSFVRTPTLVGVFLYNGVFKMADKTKTITDTYDIPLQTLIADNNIEQIKDHILVAYGDGWFDGFLKAKNYTEENTEDICELSESSIIELSEDAEQQYRTEPRKNLLIETNKELTELLNDIISSELVIINDPNIVSRIESIAKQ